MAANREQDPCSMNILVYLEELLASKANGFDCTASIHFD